MSVHTCVRFKGSERNDYSRITESSDSLNILEKGTPWPLQFRPRRHNGYGERHSFPMSVTGSFRASRNRKWLFSCPLEVLFFILVSLYAYFISFDFIVYVLLICSFTFFTFFLSLLHVSYHSY